MQALSKAQAGETYTVKWMFTEPEIKEFLRERAVEEGSMIRVIQNYAHNLIIGSGRTRIALGTEIADRIQV